MKALLRFFPVLVLLSTSLWASLPIVKVEGQPLGANVKRLLRALDFLGAPLPEGEVAKLETAAETRNAEAIQKLLDPHVYFFMFCLFVFFIKFVAQKRHEHRKW